MIRNLARGSLFEAAVKGAAVRPAALAECTPGQGELDCSCWVHVGARHLTDQ